MTIISRPDLVIDVGANQGDFALEVAARNPAVGVLAFEPIPQLCANIAAAAEKRRLDNLAALPLAVDERARTTRFHVAAHDDFGVSSLLELDHASIGRDEYWKDRKDLYVDHAIEVSVVRLDSIPAIQQAERIRFIKIDAQGVDLPALESLGEYLPRAEAGVLEVPAIRESRLYADELHDLHSVTSRLLALGFRIYAIKPNDHASREFNLFFCRHNLDWREMESALHLRGIHLYDGKHFWRSPASQLTPDAALSDMRRVVERLAVVDSALAREYAETKRLNERLAVVEPALARECAETKRLNERLAVVEPALAEAVKSLRLSKQLHLSTSGRNYS